MNSGAPTLPSPRVALRRRPRVACLALCLCLTLMPGLVHADSWIPPSPEAVIASDGKTRATITPRQIDDSLAYFTDKVEGADKAGQREGGPQQATARVERKTARGQWQTVWQGPLVNDVAPVEALLSPGGRYLVTLDNWHFLGYGDDVIVIYGERGQRLHQLALRQILPSEYVAALPRTASSRHWRGEPTLSPDGAVLRIPLRVPSRDFDDRSTVPMDIRLADAQVTLPSGPAWEQALQAAKLEIDRQRAQYDRLQERHSAPLTAPTDVALEAWNRYAYEVMYRLEAEGEPRILPAKGSNEEPMASLELEALLAGMGKPSNFPAIVDTWGLASPEPLALEAIATRALRQVHPGSARDVRIVFVGLPEQRARVTALFEATGAGFRFVDMTQTMAGKPMEPFKLFDE